MDVEAILEAILKEYGDAKADSRTLARLRKKLSL